jgi:hypothetical protein
MATSAWRCNDHNVLDHSFFVSYRVDTDKEAASQFHLELEVYSFKQKDASLGPLNGFIDTKCLNPSENWETGFLNGLKNSRVIVYLISDRSLDIMEQKLAKGVVSAQCLNITIQNCFWCMAIQTRLNADCEYVLIYCA